MEDRQSTDDEFVKLDASPTPPNTSAEEENQRESTETQQQSSDSSWPKATLSFEDELESLLVSRCDFSTLRKVVQNRPLPEAVRPRVWQVLLGVANKPDPFSTWDQLYDLPEQAILRAECQRIVEKFGNPACDRVVLRSDLESVLTLYCKARAVPFRVDGGWSQLLELLLVLALPRAQLYNVFFAFTTKYTPEGCCVTDGKPFDLFRLLLLYHDPGLCSFLDTKRIKPHLYAKLWFTSLFTGTAKLEVSLRLLDLYLQHADPFLLFFMALVMLMNAREAILAMSDESAERIAETVAGFPCQLEADDIEDFCQLALHYSAVTPQSFRRDYHGPLFGSNLSEMAFESVTVHSLLCLPVSVQELLHANQRFDTDSLHYFVVDARPLSQYNNGHLPGSFNLDASLLVDRPEEFQLAAQSLGAFKAKTHPTDHLCFMGSGRDDDDKYLHMVVSGFLQKGQQYISVARGGYEALHELLKESLSTRLKSHSVKGCLVCSMGGRNKLTKSLSSSPAKQKSPTAQNAGSPTKSPGGGVGLLGRVTAAMRVRSSAVKEKVYDYVVNAPTHNPDGTPVTDDIRHISSADRQKGGARYRGVPSVFSIADDEEDDEEESDELNAPTATAFYDSEEQPRKGKQDGTPTNSQHKQKVKLSEWLKQADIIDSFEGHHIDEKSYMHPCRLALTRTHLYVLRVNDAERDAAYVQLRRPLANLHKITSKKRIPELLTLKHGYQLSPGQHQETAVDKFLVPRAGDCAKAMKTAIVTLHDPAATTPITNSADQGAEQ